MQRQFLLSVFVFIDSSVVSALQNNVEFHLGCHTCCLSYFALGGTVDRSTITWSPNFLGCVVYHIFSAMVLCCECFARESSANKTGWLENTKWSYNFFQIWLTFCFYGNIVCSCCWQQFRRIFRSFSMGKRKQKSYGSQKIVDIV